MVDKNKDGPFPSAAAMLIVGVCERKPAINFVIFWDFLLFY